MANDDTLEHVSDTALWVAYYRGEESERPDALFRDPYAKRLAGERGRRIAAAMGPTARYTRWTLVIRTVIIDRFLTAEIAAGADTVLNLGAGLDTRPYRMDLPTTLRWVEVDHESIIAHKETLLAAETPRCRLERIRLDLTDRAARQALFARVSRESRRVVVLTEGVLPYLTPADVTELAQDLRAQANFQAWIAEYFSREAYRHINNPDRLKRMKNAPFRFFPDDWFGFFREQGWIEGETKFIGEETPKLGRKVPMPWWAYPLMILAPKPRREALARMTGYTVFR
jgi:methyltransferase (TIGR00027 family)